MPPTETARERWPFLGKPLVVVAPQGHALASRKWQLVRRRERQLWRPAQPFVAHLSLTLRGQRQGLHDRCTAFGLRPDEFAGLVWVGNGRSGFMTDRQSSAALS